MLTAEGMDYLQVVHVKLRVSGSHRLRKPYCGAEGLNVLATKKSENATRYVSPENLK